MPGPIALLLVVVGYGLLALKMFTLGHAAITKPAAFVAAGKWQKPAWLIVLSIATLWDLSAVLRFGIPSPLDFINLLGAVAALVYLVDVRPAVRATGRGKGQAGPYGPW